MKKREVAVLFGSVAALAALCAAKIGGACKAKIGGACKVLKHEPDYNHRVMPVRDDVTLLGVDIHNKEHKFVDSNFRYYHCSAEDIAAEVAKVLEKSNIENWADACKLEIYANMREHEYGVLVLDAKGHCKPIVINHMLQELGACSSVHTTVAAINYDVELDERMGKVAQLLSEHFPDKTFVFENNNPYAPFILLPEKEFKLFRELFPTELNEILDELEEAYKQKYPKAVERIAELREYREKHPDSRRSYYKEYCQA